MNRHTGGAITAQEHIPQSIIDILTTPIGARVWVREYGSWLFELVDAPSNPIGRLRAIAAVADALARWEPRVRFDRGAMSVDINGRAVLSIDVTVLEDASPLKVTVPVGGA